MPKKERRANEFGERDPYPLTKIQFDVPTVYYCTEMEPFVKEMKIRSVRENGSIMINDTEPRYMVWWDTKLEKYRAMFMVDRGHKNILTDDFDKIPELLEDLQVKTEVQNLKIISSRLTKGSGWH